jgi:butyrate kinase
MVVAFNILVINPGSTSTKIAWYEDDVETWRKTITHAPEKLSEFDGVISQLDFRLKAVEDVLKEAGYSFDDLDAVIGRGGIVDPPMPGGVYRVEEVLIEYLKRCKPWEHASNLGGLMAHSIAQPRNIPAFIADSVATDELDDIARITGLPELPKYSLAHTLNVKSVVRKAAKELDGDWRKLRFIVAHLGGGFTICAHRDGRMVDLNNANENGPFSPERAGTVPTGDLVKLCYSGKYNVKELRRKLAGASGFVGYLGTNDVREVKQRIEDGYERAALIYRAMAFQVAKEIASYSAVLEGKVDAIIMTGGVAYDDDFVAMVTERVQWIAPVLVYPGENEMKSLAENALRVLKGEEKSSSYANVVENYRKREVL